MGNRSILLTMFTLAILAHIGCSPDANRPNVILISLDTLRADHLGCYGYPRPTSPFLDQLAEQNVLFENEYVQLPGTLPSHMSILTGLYPDEHGVFPPDGALAADIPILPEVLRNAGYQTAGFTEGGYVAGHFGFARGFDQFDDDVPKLCNDIEVVFSRGLGFLRERDRSRPFFLFLHSYAIHDPYFPPVPYTDLYLEEQPPLSESTASEDFDFYRFPEMPPMTPDREKEHRLIYTATRSLIERQLPPGVPLPTGPNLGKFNRGAIDDAPPEALTFYTALYDATINYVDDVLRAFFGSLDNLKVLDNTIIVITSDHGEEFFEHDRLTHTQVYQECLHVPLIVLAPSAPTGRRVPDIVRSIDIAPTLYEMTGVKPPHRISGVSMVPFLKGGSSTEPRDAFARDIENTGRSLHSFNRRLLQVVTHKTPPQEAGHWYSKVARFKSNNTKISFRAMSYYVPRDVEVFVDGTPLIILQCTPEWQDFHLEVPGPMIGRDFLLKSSGCDIPAEIEGTSDSRCLSFRIASFPQNNLELFDLTDDPTGTINIISREGDLADSLASRLDDYEMTPVSKGDNVTLSPEDVERLKSLGYLQ